MWKNKNPLVESGKMHLSAYMFFIGEQNSHVHPVSGFYIRRISGKISIRCIPVVGGLKTRAQIMKFRKIRKFVSGLISLTQQF